MEQTVFRAAGHDPVWLLSTLGHQVVNKRADIAGVPGQDHGRTAQNFECRVDAGHQALRGSLFIAGGTVELARAIETGDQLAFQRGPQLGGVHALIFNGVGRAHHLGVLQTGDGMEHLQLHILRHTGGKTLNVHFLGVQPAGLNKELMAGLLREADDLRFNTGAVPGANAGNGAVINGTPVQIGPDDLVGPLAGIGQVAHGGVVHLMVRPEGEGFHSLVAGLQFHFGKINAAPIHPGRRAGLKTPEAQPQIPQAVRKADAGMHTVRAGGDHALPDDDGGVQIGSCGDDHSLGPVFRTQIGADTGNSPVFRQNFRNLCLLQLQMLLLFQRVLHVLLIPPPVRLGTERMDRGALAPVQHPVLDAAGICRQAHFAAQSIQFPDQMALAGAADGGIAGHIAHCVQIDGKQDGVQAQPGCGQSGLNARVARADDRHIAIFYKIGHIMPPEAPPFPSSLLWEAQRACRPPRSGGWGCPARGTSPRSRS